MNNEHTTERIPGRGNVQSDAFPVANVETADDTVAVVEDSGGSRSRAAANTVLVMAFVVAIFLPGTQMLWPMFPEHQSFENRTLAQRPGLPSTWESATAFPSNLESYFDDHFGFRNTLIRWNNLVRVEWLRSTSEIAMSVAKEDAAQVAVVGKRKRPKQQEAKRNEGASRRWRAIRGTGGWLFTDRPSERDYCRGKLFTEEELAQLVETFKRRGAEFAEHGVHYVVVVVPTAHTVYAEFLPDQFRPVASYLRLDQLVNALEGDPHVMLINVRPAVLEAKKQLRTHHRTDSHWNDFGAFVAYREIMEHLGVWFDNVSPWGFSKFEVRRHEGSSPGDLVFMLGFTDRFYEDAINLVPIKPRLAEPPFPVPEGILRPKQRQLFLSEQTTTLSNTTLPRAVILHDSYAWYLMPFLSEHFSYAKYHFVRTYCDVGATLEEQPDVVIQLFTELTLAYPMSTGD